MTQNSINNFVFEIYSKSPKKIYTTNKTDVYHNSDIWSFFKLILKDFTPEKIRASNYVLVVIDDLINFG